MTYLTDEELDALQSSSLDPFTPYGIQDVSQSQFSVARHYGRCTYSGRHYIYIPTTDELIREDVVQWVTKRREEARRAAQREDIDRQIRLL